MATSNTTTPEQSLIRDGIQCSVTITSVNTPSTATLEQEIALKKPASWTEEEYQLLAKGDGITCTLAEGLSLIERLGPIQSVSRGNLVHLVFETLALEINDSHGRFGTNPYDGFEWSLNADRTAWNVCVLFPKDDVQIRFSLDDGYSRRGRPCVIVRCYLRDTKDAPVVPNDSDDEIFDDLCDAERGYYQSKKTSTSRVVLTSIPIAPTQ